MKGIEKLTPKESIRAYCRQCLGMKQFNTDEDRECQGDTIKCPLFAYRLGKRPKVFRAFRPIRTDPASGWLTGYTFYRRKI